MKTNKINKLLKKLALFLNRNSLVVIFLDIFFCLIVAGLVFYFFVVTPREKTFNVSNKTPTLNQKLYDKALNNLEKSKEVEDNSFLQSENKKQEDENEQIEVKEGISEEDLELALAKTLFELYEFDNSEMPTISERAKIWEDLGIGNKENYRGSYSQNITLLEKLKEEAAARE